MTTSVEQTYQKKTPLEHVLLRPDTYVGSVVPQTARAWVLDRATQTIEHREITVVPALYKIFDELLVNAADNKQRDPRMSELRVTLAADHVVVHNNGRGLPVVIHGDHGCYVPELVFGHLLTSSNYNDAERKTTGGRNGFGAKLTNIFSRRFVVETEDTERRLRYRQVWSDNMRERSAPSIEPAGALGRDCTTVTFWPDLARLGLGAATTLDRDTLDLFARRVWDVAGTVPGLRVWLDGAVVPIAQFESYVRRFAPAAVYHRLDAAWEFAAVASPDGEFRQLSFVNGIHTAGGGTHVGAVADPLAKAIAATLGKRAPAGGLRPIRAQIWVFVNALVVNPAFDSQAKHTLTSRLSAPCGDLPPAWVKRVLHAGGVADAVLRWVKTREDKDLGRTDGRKRKRVAGVPKLVDAHNAGGAGSRHCTLILTEGDSAKALAVSGLSVVGRASYGVFPLKGKFINVRDASAAQVAANTEVIALKQIIGLKHGVEYESTRYLRYGRVLLMADQDHDGSHIKGLVINFFSTFWPSLLRLPGFLCFFVTPIVKCRRGALTETFYTLPEYQQWAARRLAGWSVKYYKGLGTSTTAEAAEYFKAMDRHVVKYVHAGPDDDASLDLAFNKKRANARKAWIAAHQPGTFLPQAAQVSFHDFVHKELVLFSIAANVRAIPSMVDGLKPGQRKVLHCCLRRKITSDIKVVQLAGLVSEQTAYHHGEVSLQDTIVGLAQRYVGSNNLNLLEPSGQFGTRNEGGQDAASARYIFTRLNPAARLVFPAADDALLAYLDDDGKRVEPAYFAPVIPMVLVNGAAGIGSGWSTAIPCYRPLDLVAAVRARLDGAPGPPLHPWYRGFAGSLVVQASGYVVCGALRVLEADPRLVIDELPIHTWTTPYRAVLDGLVESGVIGGVTENHGDDTVSFALEASAAQLAAVRAAGLFATLRLSTPLSTANMVLFDDRGALVRYASADAIVDAWFAVRMAMYIARRTWLLDQLGVEVARLENRARFVTEVVARTLDLCNKPRAALDAELVGRGYADVEDLLRLPLSTLTTERVAALCAERDAVQSERERVAATSPTDAWRADLIALETWLEADERTTPTAQRRVLPKVVTHTVE